MNLCIVFDVINLILRNINVRNDKELYLFLIYKCGSRNKVLKDVRNFYKYKISSEIKKFVNYYPIIDFYKKRIIGLYIKIKHNIDEYFPKRSVKEFLDCMEKYVDLDNLQILKIDTIKDNKMNLVFHFDPGKIKNIKILHLGNFKFTTFLYTKFIYNIDTLVICNSTVDFEFLCENYNIKKINIYNCCFTNFYDIPNSIKFEFVDCVDLNRESTLNFLNYIKMKRHRLKVNRQILQYSSYN